MSTAEHVTDVEVYDPPMQSMTLLPANLTPAEQVEQFTAVADALSQVIRSKGLAVSIKGREHVKVEGWTLLGSLLGVFPEVEWSRPVEDGWEARVVARTLAGQVVGSAEAMCLRSESSWKSRDEYAVRSMAQTRAVSKAMRVPLGFVMQLAGFEATPADEMPTTDDSPFQAPAPRGPDEEVRIHFGKNGPSEEHPHGIALGSLTDAQLKWYALEWVVDSSSTDQDRLLKDAAMRVHDSRIPFG